MTCRILLEGCSLRNDDSTSAVEREGQNAVDLGNSVTDTSTLVAADVPEKSGHSHKFHFILDTPSRPYTFACNTMEQKFAWMLLLKRAIIAADKIVDAECFVCSKLCFLLELMLSSRVILVVTQQVRL